jgi:predicted ATPase
VGEREGVDTHGSLKERDGLPLLLACPGARIYSFDATPVAEVSYEDIDHVNLMRDFLNDPQRYLRHFD